ncbi:hypothetical protein [Azospirillum sp. sgz301742]
MHRLGVGLLFASAALCGFGGPAGANEGAATANTCPYESPVTVALGKRSITIPQSAFSPTSTITDIDGYELRLDHKLLIVELVGQKGDVWRAPMTKLVRDKRCQGIYLGRPVQAAAGE